jgi:hypothetical protein
MNQGCPSHSKIGSASSFFEDRSILFRASSTDSIRLAAPARSFAGTSVGQDDVPLPAIGPRMVHRLRDRRRRRAAELARASGAWRRPADMRLTADQRRALAMLADAGPRGCTESIMLAHGFKLAMLAELVRNGWTTAAPETVRAGCGRSRSPASGLPRKGGGRSWNEPRRRGPPRYAH